MTKAVQVHLEMLRNFSSVLKSADLALEQLMSSLYLQQILLIMPIITTMPRKYLSIQTPDINFPPKFSVAILVQYNVDS